jgi:hypothetical protein
MLAEDLLLTLAEIAVALVGFSALVALFQGTRDRALDDGKRFRVRMLIESGLQGALFAVLPHTLVAFGVSEASVWRPASGLLALAGAFIPIVNVRRAVALKLAFIPSDLILIVVGAAVEVALVLNFLAIGFSGTAGPYVLAVIWTLVVAAYFFLMIAAGRRD